MAYKLVYFPVRGRAEAIRFILADQDAELEFVDVNTEGWDTWKPKMHFGQCPAFYDGDYSLVQSNTILRYLGKKFDLYGTDAKDQGLIDMFNDSVEDMRMAYIIMIYRNYEDGREPYGKELPEKLALFEKNLERFGGKFLVGDKISYADYNLFDFLMAQQLSFPGCLKEFKLLSDFYANMSERPKLKKYVSTDDFKNRPVNGNGKL